MDEMDRGRKAPKKRPNLLVRLLAFLVTAALVVGAVFLVANYDKLNFDALKRWFAYRDLERSETGESASFTFEGGAGSAFGLLAGDLLVCSGTEVRLYSDSGQVYVDQAVSMEAPVVSTAGNAALVYDVGGTALFVYRDREEVFSLALEEGQQLLSAALNPQGKLVVVSHESGHRALVTVYDGDFAPQLRLNLSTRFVMDAALSPDGTAVALASMGLDGEAFETRIEHYELDRTAEETEPDWTCSLGNDTALALRWDSSGIWVLGETGLSILSPSGEVTGYAGYGGLYLKDFSLTGDGTAALLLGRYRAGTDSQLWTVSPDGTTRAALPVEEQVLSLSAAGRYVGLLTADRLDVYDQNLEPYSTLEGTQGAQKVLQQADGSAMLIANAAAWLYLPQ